tara:strand:+ start:84 stop:356 length:273 start_codon:yes stop_codon:yes gene_type:complete
MPQINREVGKFPHRRHRIHELLIALIHQQDPLELMEGEIAISDGKSVLSPDLDPARWLDRNRRVLNKYQALVRSAVTLDALIDAEEDSLN